MDIEIKAIGVEHTAPIDSYVEEKIGGLEKFLKRVGSPHTVHVELGKATAHHRHGAVMFCHAHLTVPGRTLHAEAEADDLYAAVDLARADLERQIIRYKEQNRKPRRGGVRGRSISR